MASRVGQADVLNGKLLPWTVVGVNLVVRDDASLVKTWHGCWLWGHVHALVAVSYG